MSTPLSDLSSSSFPKTGSMARQTSLGQSRTWNSPNSMPQQTTSNTAPQMNHHTKDNMSHYGYGWAWAIIVFIILVIIIWVILWAVKPTWVQKCDSHGNSTGCIDNGKAFLWAVVIAIIICVIIWLVRAAAYYEY